MSNPLAVLIANEKNEHQQCRAEIERLKRALMEIRDYDQKIKPMFTQKQLAERALSR